MSHSLGPPAALTSEPGVWNERLIRLTAQLVGRMLRPSPTDQLPASEANHAPESSVCSPART
jgi:hypothetical protein